MIAVLAATALLAQKPLGAPKRPDLGLYWLVSDLRGADTIKMRPHWVIEPPRWVKLYGVDVPNPSQRGYSGARQDLEILLGREGEVYFEDEKKDHPITRGGNWVQYVWAW